MFNCFDMIREKGVKMISKELLSEVLGIDKRLCRLDKVVDNTLFFYTFRNAGEYQNYINIYELAHKCKEWAKSKDYYILSGYDDTNIPVSLINHNHGENSYCCDEYFEANTEPEANFKACQWILDNKED